MTIEQLIAEREQQIARLRELYRFSPTEAEDFLDRFGSGPAESGSKEPSA